MRNMTEKQFEILTGYKPVQDDLERVNCEQAGEVGHEHCGWDYENGRPRFEGAPAKEAA